MGRIDICLARLGRGIVVLAVTVAVAPALLIASSAQATTVSQDITTAAGPLTNIWLGNDLDCQVQYAGEAAYEFYPSASAPGDCGTFVSVNSPPSSRAGGGATLYGPNLATNPGGSAAAALLKATTYGSGSSSTSIGSGTGSQSTVTGSGTSASPYSVTTDVLAGSSGLSVDETDSYVAGDTSYRTDITLVNTGNTTLSGRLYRAADCYLQGTDSGYGEFNSSTSAPGCTQTANNSPPGLAEEFVPLTGGSHYVEGLNTTVWNDIAAQGDLPGICDCTINEDNGAGLNWDYSVPTGSSQTFSMLTNFSAPVALAASPVDQTAPSVTGAPIVGATLTESHGTWSNNPTGYAYQWEDCDAVGANCVTIAGASGQTYTLAATDAGHTIRAVETASNANGPGAPAPSPPTALVQAPAQPGQPVTVTTRQTLGTQSGDALSIPAGTVGETDGATLTGANVAQATGTIDYALYSTASCVASSSVFRSTQRTVSGATVPASSPVTTVLVAGTYYWKATYSGDLTNDPATSRCGAEVLTVTPPDSAAPTGTANTASVKLKVGCAIVPCTLTLTLTGTEKVEVPASVAQVPKKRPKKKFRTETVTIASDAVHIIRRGDVAVDAKLTKKGKRYLSSRRGHVRLKLTISETIKSTKLITERTVNVGIAKVLSSGGSGSGEHPKK